MKTNHLIGISIASLVAGIFLFFFLNGWLALQINFPTSNQSGINTIPQAKSYHKEIELYYWLSNTLKHEKKKILWSENPSQDSQTIIKNWLTLLDNEEILQKKTTLQHAAITPNKELIISFDRAPFNEESSTHEKLMIIESLLKTIHESRLPINFIRFLGHSKTLSDIHLDFSRPWPISGFVNSTKEHLEYIKRDPSYIKKNNGGPFTIVLDPAGDAQVTGRIIDDTFERGITLQCAEKIKTLLESRLSNTRIILTRLPGEALEILQNARFANRLKADLYLSIHFYHAKGHDTPLNVYYFLYDPISDFLHKETDNLSFTPHHSAHTKHTKATTTASYRIAQELSKLVQQFTIHDPLGIPFKPLIGVTAPAIAIEAALHDKKDWDKLCEPLANTLVNIIANPQH